MSASLTRLFREAATQALLRNVAVAMGNSSNVAFREVLEQLAQSPEGTVREHAEWALERLGFRSAPDAGESG